VRSVDDVPGKPERSAQLFLDDGDDREPLTCSPFPRESLMALEGILPRTEGAWVGGPLRTR
jgi:hypothetical protein